MLKFTLAVAWGLFGVTRVFAIFDGPNQSLQGGQDPVCLSANSELLLKLNDKKD